MNKNNILTRFNEGSTHENNPLSGVPIGNNNSVEEGETKQNNFVYSNRIFLDSNIVSQYNLPKSLVGKSVADATKLIDNKFKGRNDKISQSTKNGMLSKIAEAQEAMKPQEPEIEQQGYSEEMVNPSQMALGGYVNRFDGDGFYEPIQPVNQLNNANNLSQLNTFNNTIPSSNTKIQLNTSDNSLNAATNSNPQTSNNTANTLGSAGLAIGSGIKNIPSGALDKQYAFNPKLKAGDDAMDSVKKTVATAIPIAGAFYGIEKMGLAAGEAIGGEKGRDVATGIFDPSSGQREVLQSKDSSNFEKGVSLAAPFLSGLMAGKARKRTEAKVIANNAQAANRMYSEDYYAMGGEIDPIIENKQTWDTKKIVKYQPGVTSGKNGNPGFYIYSKNPLQGDFIPERDREFVRQENMMDLQRTPQWKEYQQSLMINKQQPIAKFALGGKMNQLAWGTDDINKDPYFFESRRNPIIGKTGFYGPNILPKQVFNDSSEPINIPEQVIKPTQTQAEFENYANQHQTIKPGFGKKVWEGTKTVGKYGYENAGNIARYAPIAANLLQLKNLKKPQGEVLDRLGNRYRPEYVDEAALQNIANQTMNNSISAIGQSGASQGQLRSSIIGSQLERTKAISDAYAQAAAQNRATNDRAQTFNLGVDQVNLQQSNTEKDNNARDQAAYRNAKREYITGIGEGIGRIGDEQAYKKIAKNTTGYTWDGTYVKTPDGNIVTNPTTGKPMTQEELKQSQTAKDKKALGGYLIKNKVK